MAFRFAGRIFISTVVLGTAALTWALQPPTPEQLERYRQDGSLSRRVAAAHALGNHLVAPELMDRLQQRDDQARSMTTATTGLPSIGSPRVFALLIDFSNHESHTSTAVVDGKLFGEGTASSFPYNSLRDFYRRSSYGLLELQGATLGWYTTPYSRGQIEETTTGREALIREAIDHFDSQGHDFSQYDASGDGEIDYFLVIWAGPTQDWADFWWGYLTRFTNKSYTVDGLTLGRYSWQWESTDARPFDPLVTIHETGHALGLPDYYDYDDDVGPMGGVGGLDMMDGNQADHNAFSKWMLGWLTPERYNEETNIVSLRPQSEYPDAAVLMHGDPPSDPYTEYFVVEHRRRTANDDNLPTDGLLIWHVDARLGSSGGFLSDNSYTEHKLLRLMEADGLEEIEQNRRADADDFYTNDDILSPTTTPNTNRYDGARTNLTVSGINDAGSEIQLSAALGSGCAIWCGAAVPGAAWPGSPVFFDGTADAQNCEGNVLQRWKVGEITTGLTSLDFDHIFARQGHFEWRLETRLGDASCNRKGSLLVCTDVRCWSWRDTPPMEYGRALHTARKLADGRVLVVGGGGAPELYDPAAETWQAAPPSTGVFEYARSVVLADGRMLVTGATPNDPIDSEIFNPADDSWSRPGQMVHPRSYHSMVRLADGRVLVAGGYLEDGEGGETTVIISEIFDPSTGTYTTSGSIGERMEIPGLTLLADGLVLLTGNDTAKTFNPQTTVWRPIATPAISRLYHASVGLADGRVMLVGGISAQEAEIYDPSTNSWSSGGTLSEVRIAPAVNLLPSGQVIVTGGSNDHGEVSATAEAWDPATGEWSNVGSMRGIRLGHHQTLLEDGGLLVTGGSTGLGSDWTQLATSERYAPPAGVSSARRPGGRKQNTGGS